LLKRRRNATTRGIVLTDCPQRRRNIFLCIAPRGGGKMFHRLPQEKEENSSSFCSNRRRIMFYRLPKEEEENS
jgi:hypothetical protein